MRILGGLLVGLGLLLSLTIFAAPVGIPMMFIGALLFFIGRKRSPIIVQVNNKE